MANVRLNVDANGAAQFRRQAERLKRLANGDFERELAVAVRRESREVLDEVRAAARAVEVTSSRGGQAPPSYSRNLRRRVASATYVSVRKDGVSFRVSGARVGSDGYGYALARYLDGTLRRARNWRHPVFQNPQRTKPWVTQHGSPWFFVTIRANRHEFASALRRALSSIARG